MRGEMVTMGNVQFIQLPGAVLQQCPLQKSVDIRVEGESLIISNTKKNRRSGWREAFQKAGEEERKMLYDDALENTWDECWIWEE